MEKTSLREDFLKLNSEEFRKATFSTSSLTHADKLEMGYLTDKK